MLVSNNALTHSLSKQVCTGGSVKPDMNQNEANCKAVGRKASWFMPPVMLVLGLPTSPTTLPTLGQKEAQYTRGWQITLVPNNRRLSCCSGRLCAEIEKDLVSDFQVSIFRVFLFLFFLIDGLLSHKWLHSLAAIPWRCTLNYQIKWVSEYTEVALTRTTVQHGLC